MARTRSLALKALLLAICLSGIAGTVAEGALVTPGVGDARSEISVEMKPDRIPVVLVHGLRGNGPSTWGQPEDEDDRPEGIYLALCRAGYQPGQTLFVCDYREDNLGDYREIAQRDVPAAIDKALAASGSDRVDLVSRSMGGLVARAYVTSDTYRGDVRTLVMIATPHRGSFGANIVRAMEMIHLQEQLRNRDTLHRRPLDRPTIPAPEDLFGDFTDEVSYVARQSRELWEPLFGYYYATSWLLQERGGGGRTTPQDFLAWLVSAQPAIYAALVSAQQPPKQPSYLTAQGFRTVVPGPGESLTRAYYEAVAMQCARHNFFQALGGQPKEALPEAKPKGIIEVVVGWVEGLIAKVAGTLFREKGQGLAVWAMEHLAGLDPKARAGECLVEQQFKLSLGGPMTVAGGASSKASVAGSADPDGTDLVANYYLQAWNEADATRRAAQMDFGAELDDWPPGVRYVSIAGQVPNLWSRLWPDVEANDLIVETSSTYIPLADNDAYFLLPSILRTNHVWLGGSGAALKALTGALKDYYPIKASYKPRYTPGKSKLVEYSRQGTGKAEVHKPCYVELKLPSAHGKARVEVTFSATGPATPDAWAYLEVPGSGIRRYPLAFAQSAEGTLRASTDVPAPTVDGARVLLGVRLLPPDRAQAPPPNETRSFKWRLGYTPAPPGAEAIAKPQVSAESTSRPSAFPGQPTGEVAHLPTGTPEGSPAGSVSVPVIHATHRDKETTSMEASVTRHARWVWMFGDGSSTVDDDPAAMECSRTHAYGAPGIYSCRATSWSSEGWVLADYQWQVHIGAEDVAVPKEFSAQTLSSPDIRLELIGPVAWVTGLPARYTIEYEITMPQTSGTSAQVAYLYPAQEFEMIWERPGEFTVTGALALRLTYPSGSGLASVTNVYTVEKKVKVHAMVVTE